MLDHVFTDAIGALRDSLERALLERQAFEERFQVDVLLGDVTWEPSYGLRGEGLPPRVQADLTLDWPTWAQTAYRSWYIGEPFADPPRIEIELVLRLQRLAESPDPSVVLAALPEMSASIGSEHLEPSGPTIATGRPRRSRPCARPTSTIASTPSRCRTRAATSWTRPRWRTAPSSMTT